MYDNTYGYTLNTITKSSTEGYANLNFHGGLGCNCSSNRRSFTSDATLALNTWYNIACTIKDYNDMEIYIDCNQSTGTYSGTGSTTIKYSNDSSSIGFHKGDRVNTNGTYCDAMIDEFNIWNRELTQNEREYLCNSNQTVAINNPTKNNFSIYPNPTKNILNISDEDIPYKIYDSLGNLLLQGLSSDVNISTLKSGLYYLSVKNGSTSQNQSFIKN